MTKILDPGHKYELLTLDGKMVQTLTFVKRFDPKRPEKFPGNKNAYAGTTLQSVLQACCNRIRYLDNQIPCLENQVILNKLQEALMMLEQRAATRHGMTISAMRLDSFEFAKLCQIGRAHV